MPTLTSIGEEAVISHHKAVPLHLLVEDAARSMSEAHNARTDRWSERPAG